ncbi:hypothetical protein EIP86_003081 [Pleurotus ostreatoroseus]|nr:hypothetical protein EIP86_003081 [Pleurotus ostreatoroseus]
MPKRKRTVSTAVVAQTSTVTLDASSTIVTTEEATPRRTLKRVKKSKKAAIAEEVPWDYPNNDSPPPAEEDDDEFKTKGGSKSPSKRKRRKKNEEPVVYDIPPVERKYTNFKGTILVNVIVYLILTSILTCRLDTIRKNGLDFAKNLGLQNCRDLYKLVEWNEENNIRFLRISSEMFPFASHKEYGYDLDYAKDELKRVGDLAKRLGHRLTTHPGQFTQIASPKENVVEASVRELDYHCQMMRHMGLDQDSVIIIHMGGVYGDKPNTLERFKENYTAKLTDEMKARVVLENDEMCYNPDDLLPVCTELNIPIVPSEHPLSTLIPMINETWLRKGIKPKQHLSSPRPGCEEGTVMEKRAHADRCYTLPDELVLPPSEDGHPPVEVDLMIEVCLDSTSSRSTLESSYHITSQAKDKEQAVFLLYRIYDLATVKYENLRPEKPQKQPLLDEDDHKQTLEDKEEKTLPSNATSDSPTKRGRRSGRGKKLEPEASIADGVSATPVDGAPPSPRKHASRHQKVTQPEEDETSSSKEVETLINQEDALVPVDGTTAEIVEAQEHPEAAAAAIVDGDGCGVSSSLKKAKKVKRSNRGKGRQRLQGTA